LIGDTTSQTDHLLHFTLSLRDDIAGDFMPTLSGRDDKSAMTTVHSVRRATAACLVFAALFSVQSYYITPTIISLNSVCGTSCGCSAHSTFLPLLVGVNDANSPTKVIRGPVLLCVLIDGCGLSYLRCLHQVAQVGRHELIVRSNCKDCAG
jgi:hypothetical protein